MNGNFGGRLAGTTLDQPRTNLAGMEPTEADLPRLMSRRDVLEAELATVKAQIDRIEANQFGAHQAQRRSWAQQNKFCGLFD